MFYFLPNEGQRVAVCKTFFLKTLDISDTMVFHALENSEHHVAKSPPVKKAYNKTPDSAVRKVKDHINSFNRVPSHYCRKDSKKEYLEQGLNIRQMYSMYLAECAAKEFVPVAEHIYRNIFNNDFNLAFHIPSKDQCDTCRMYKLKIQTGTGDPEDKQKYVQHLNRKETARVHKEKDKVPVEGRKTASFDLQQVFMCPKLNLGSAYYLRKLNIYNFTIYEMDSKEGYCYVWPETEGGRGGNEIATCVYSWLLEKDKEGIQNIILYSDSCAGQNKNRIMTTAILKFLSSSKSVSRIDHKFLEKGHTFMEVDSMHALIERKMKGHEIYLPSGFAESAKAACKVKPYRVQTLTHKDFKDFADLNEKVMKPMALAGISSVHWMKYERDETGPKISFTENYDEQKFHDIYYRKRGCGNLSTTTIENVKKQLELDEQKKHDIRKLLQYIPADCRGYYHQIINN